MISGLVSPKSIGLTNETDIKRIVKISKIYFYLVGKLAKQLIPLLAFFSYFIPFSLKFSIERSIIVGIPLGFIWMSWVYYTFSFILWQLIYFQIICYYLESKLSNINQTIKMYIRNKKVLKSTNLKGLIESLNSLYLEINDYNDRYWSKFLFLIWITFAAIISSLSYTTILGDMNLMNRLALFYALMNLLFTLLLIIKITSSINSEASKSYKLLNSLMITFSRNHSDRNLLANKLRLKV